MTHPGLENPSQQPPQTPESAEFCGVEHAPDALFMQCSADGQGASVGTRERLAFWRFKAGTWLAWMIVRPLPIPFDRPGTRYYRLMAWLWGWAYVGDFDLETWRSFRIHHSEAA